MRRHLEAVLKAQPKPHLLRERKSLKWWKPDRELLATVDSVLCYIWQTDGGDSYWFLNCLVYVGASAVTEWAEARRSGAESETIDEQGGDADNGATQDQGWDELDYEFWQAEAFLDA